MKRISTLPNLLTLANAGCGLLAISKAIDALASRGDEVRFDRLLEASCWLILLAGVLDALDGRIARMTDSFSDFGAQLDSFADAITFGVAPAMIAKVLLEHEDLLHPRIHFLAAASFSPLLARASASFAYISAALPRSSALAAAFWLRTAAISLIAATACGWLQDESCNLSARAAFCGLATRDR